MRRLLAGALALAVMAAPAMAQQGEGGNPVRTPRARPALTGNPIDDIKNAAGGGQSATTNTPDTESKLANILAKPFNDLADFLNSDAAAAVALSTAVPELQDGHGQQCWMEMGTFTAVIKAHPIPISLHAMTDFEALRLAGMAANRLCINVHCTQVFADAGAMAQAASPIPLMIPSLHDLCSKIPQIAVVPPVAVTPAATPAPANP